MKPGSARLLAEGAVIVWRFGSGSGDGVRVLAVALLQLGSGHHHIDLLTAATTRSTLRPLVIYIYARKRFLQSLVLVLSMLIGPRSGLGSAYLVNDRELHRGDPVFNSIDNPQPRKFH